MTVYSWQKKFWWQWIAANSLAEFIGLGTVAVVGYFAVKQLGEPHGLGQSLSYAGLFILLGAFEGLVVGLAQVRILLQRLPEVHGWVRATVIGAVVAWTLGMAPSTLMNLDESSTTGTSPEINEPVVLLLAAGLGLVAGPLLALFQWRRLRRHVTRRAVWWLPANAVAWMLGMPMIFFGADMSALTTNPILITLGIGLSLLAAGAVVGAVHGRVLIWLMS